jgi:hypothetical protein
MKKKLPPWVRCFTHLRWSPGKVWLIHKWSRAGPNRWRNNACDNPSDETYPVCSQYERLAIPSKDVQHGGFGISHTSAEEYHIGQHQIVGCHFPLT